MSPAPTTYFYAFIDPGGGLVVREEDFVYPPCDWRTTRKDAISDLVNRLGQVYSKKVHASRAAKEQELAAWSRYKAAWDAYYPAQKEQDDQ